MFNKCCYPVPHQCPCCGMMTPHHQMVCPCCGCGAQECPKPVEMPACPCQTPCPAPTQFESCKQVMEPCVTCTQEYHHHHKVEHVVPVMVKNIHCHHNHHCYMIDKKECDETFNTDHGIRQEDWCAVAKAQCCPR